MTSLSASTFILPPPRSFLITDDPLKLGIVWLVVVELGCRRTILLVSQVPVSTIHYSLERRRVFS